MLDDERAVKIANLLAKGLSQKELIALSWLAIERDNETTPDLLRAYEQVRRINRWSMIDKEESCTS